MKNKKRIISIFILIMSVFACCFVFADNKIINVNAAQQNDCYYLLNQEGEAYLANVAVGKVEGEGKYVVGEQNVVLRANANLNYQLAGWQIIFEEQENKILFIDDLSLENGSKSFELTAKNGTTKVQASVDFFKKDNLYQSGNFKLSYVFEDLIIRPVFKNVYYSVDVSELTQITTLKSKSIGLDTLYYKASTVDGEETVYSNSFIKIGEEYNFYGNLFERDGKYFTRHKTLNDDEQTEEVEYSLGAFRIGDTVEIDLDVDIENKIEVSKNIDLVRTSIVGGSTVELIKNAEKNSFTIQQDEFLRTIGYSFNFDVISSNNQKNILDITYHDLYVVDLEIFVDDQKSNENQISEIFGQTTLKDKNIEGNISIFNFYSKITDDNLKFLIKKAQDNNAKPFKVAVAPTVDKNIDNISYRYYNFTSLDGGQDTSKSYDNRSSNFTVDIRYSSELYFVNFLCAEFVNEIGSTLLQDMVGNILEPFAKKRGETISLNLDSAKNIENVGYKFVGYATSLDSEVLEFFSYAFDETKPASTTVYMCFEKISYEVVFTNFNKVQTDSTNPLKTVKFTIDNGYGAKTQELTATNLLDQESITLSNVLKVNGYIKIDKTYNPGFNILGFSTKAPNEVTPNDYFTEFYFNAAFISSDNVQDKIIIYVYEEVIKYTITYFIDPSLDTTSGENVIMANISAECDGATIEKYDVNNQLICTQNNNLTNIVKKIVISNLKYNDKLLLHSEGLTTESGDYYLFNCFTEDNIATLTYTLESNVYTREEIVARNRSIKVIYSMPKTRVRIVIDEEFASNEQFDLKIQVAFKGTELTSIEQGAYVYEDDNLKQGETITVILSELSFGYMFEQYTVLEAGKVENDFTFYNSQYSFDYKTISDINTLELSFKRIVYHFIFTQYGGGKDGEHVMFNDKNFAALDVDNTSVMIEKPLGYFVSSVKFAEINQEYSEMLSENNDFRLQEDILNYNFSIERDDFISIIQSYGVLNPQTKISEISVRLDYSIFKYSVQLQYGLTNPKQDETNSDVVYPPVKLSYQINGETFDALKEFDNPNRITIFTNIPYNAVATINLLGGAPLGLSLSGWAHQNGNMVLGTEFTHSLEYLIVGNLVEDKAFIYYLTFNTYYIRLNADNSQGSPEVRINNKLILGNDKPITLYDNLQIASNASRDKGYVFDKIIYNVNKFEEYVYNNATWNVDQSTLYVKQGANYILNSSNQYDSKKTYYIRKIEEIVHTSEKFEDVKFFVFNYMLDEDGKGITFNVVYKLRQLTVENRIEEYAKYDMWTLLGRGKETSRIQFESSDLIVLNITAKNNSNEIRTISGDTTVTYFDVLTVKISINKEATNFNGEKYDLSQGLTLKTFSVNGKTIKAKELEKGEYIVDFYVGNYLPMDSDNIVLIYTVQLSGKSVSTTTIIKDSSTFYKNLVLKIDAHKYGFEDSFVVTENGAKSLKYNLQFLAKTSIQATFISSEYQNNFGVSGCYIYLNDEEIQPSQYELYGIRLNEDNSIDARIFGKLDVVFIVQPKITYNGGPAYQKTFECDNLGNGLPQGLSVGIDANYDIQVASILVDAVTISYISTAINSFAVYNVKDVGRYNVIIAFANVEGFDWLSEIKVAENVTITIQPKQLFISYDAERLQKTTKIYDSQSAYDAKQIYKYLNITDNKSFNVKYSEIMNVPNNKLTLGSALSYISTFGKDAAVADANESVYYNLYVYDITLVNTQFNNNFSLANSDLIIYDYIQILKREIKIQGIEIYSKVYDGTDKAEMVSKTDFPIYNSIKDDDVHVNGLKLNPRFENSSIGTDKSVIIDAANSLIGMDAGNYFVKPVEIKGLCIYPYSVSLDINGLGKVEVINKRGLTNKEMVNLIPVEAILKVNVIRPETHEYVSMYNKINKYLKGNNEFALGYEISFMINGNSSPINNNLYLSIPKVKNITGSYFLTGQKTGSLEYGYEEGNMIIDLTQIETNVSHIFITKTKILLKAWQIILIIVGILLIIAMAVIILLIIRKRKMSRDSIHEKI